MRRVNLNSFFQVKKNVLTFTKMKAPRGQGFCLLVITLFIASTVEQSLARDRHKACVNEGIIIVIMH